jgi:hypothetical protein
LYEKYDDKRRTERIKTRRRRKSREVGRLRYGREEV